MKSLHFLKKLKLVDLDTLYVGFAKKWIEATEIQSFAEEMVLNGSKDTNIIWLMSCSEESYHDILQKLAKHLTEYNPLDTNSVAMKKWRLAKMLSVLTNDKSNEEKVEFLQQIYAEFGFPYDMAPVSPYYFPDNEQKREIKISEIYESPLDAAKRIIKNLANEVGVNLTILKSIYNI